MASVEGVEHHLQVPRTARYWTTGEPSRAEEAWFVLHGYKQLARRFLKRFEGIANEHRLIVAPEALSRFYASDEPGRHGPASIVGASWMTREDRLTEISDYVTYLDRVADTVLPSGMPVTVLGFSQGATTAARWVTLGRVKARRLILWAGAMPHDLDVTRARKAFGDVDVILARGTEDPGMTAELAASERIMLDRAGIAYRTVSYEGRHEIEADALLRIATG